MFYAGADFVTKGHAYRSCDWDSATALVDRLLASYFAYSLRISSSIRATEFALLTRRAKGITPVRVAEVKR